LLEFAQRIGAIYIETSRTPPHREPTEYAMHNPFYYGRTVEGAAFINRENEIRQISSDLERGQSVILFSPRRYGKTSVIRRVIEKLRKRKVLCFYVDLYTVASLDEFYSRYSTAVARSLRSPAESLVSLMQSLLPLVKPKLVYAEPGAPSIEIEAGLPVLRQPATLRELFESVERYCAKRGRRATVVFDEFQEITALDCGSELEREMRSVFQHHQHVSYAFLGSKMHLMNELFKDKNRPFYNFGRRVELDAIAADHWRKDIADKFSAGGYEIDRPAVEAIIDASQGHPYYTQLLCSEIWDRHTDTRTVTASDVASVIQTAIDKESHAFQELWDSLTGAQRRMVQVLSREPEIEIYSADAVRRHNLGALSSITRIIGQLQKRGIVTRKEQRHVLTDPFVAKWIALRR